MQPVRFKIATGLAADSITKIGARTESGKTFCGC